MKQTKPKPTTELTESTKEEKQVVLTAKHFIQRLDALLSRVKFNKNEHGSKDDDNLPGIRMGVLFALAKELINMPLNEIEKLLESKMYGARVGAVSIMDFKARDKKTGESTRKELFNLYIQRHERIDTWDMVDRSAPYVVGGYLFDKPRDILYKLAKSKNVWERRTAIVSTYFFIRQGDIDDTFKIAEMLVNDKHDAIHKAVGSWIREAGKKDKQRLLKFLDNHAAIMSRTMLRYAIEHLDKKEKERYMNM
jgi:3-methyladenine DNA glycosylase AlkD